jgi:hypothetical protein
MYIIITQKLQSDTTNYFVNIGQNVIGNQVPKFREVKFSEGKDGRSDKETSDQNSLMLGLGIHIPSFVPKDRNNFYLLQMRQ